MSAPKNYQQYRETLTIRMAVLGTDVEDWRGTAAPYLNMCILKYIEVNCDFWLFWVVESSGAAVSSGRSGGRSRLKRVSSMTSTLYLDNTSSGVVPHLGAHLAELVTIEGKRCIWLKYDSLQVHAFCGSEGNPTYLPNAPHLFNMEKKRLCARALLQLRRVQRVHYTFHTLPLIQLVLTREFAKGRRLSSAQSTEWSRRMYNMSLQLEGNGRAVGHAAASVNITSSQGAQSSAAVPATRGDVVLSPSKSNARLSTVAEDELSTASVTSGENTSRPPLHKKKFFSFKKNKDKNRDDKSVESVVDEQKLNRQKLLGTSADARKRNL